MVFQVLFEAWCFTHLYARSLRKKRVLAGGRGRGVDLREDAVRRAAELAGWKAPLSKARQYKHVIQ